MTFISKTSIILISLLFIFTTNVLSQSKINSSKENILKKICLASDMTFLQELNEKQILDIFSVPNLRSINHIINKRYFASRTWSLKEKGWKIYVQSNLPGDEEEDLLILDYTEDYGISFGLDVLNHPHKCKHIIFSENFVYNILGVEFSSLLDEEKTIDALKLFYNKVFMMNVLAVPSPYKESTFDVKAKEYYIEHFKNLYLSIYPEERKVKFTLAQVKFHISSIVDSEGKEIDKSIINDFEGFEAQFNE